MEFLRSFLRHLWRASDCKTRTTTSTRFSQYWVVHAREPASFWSENVIAIVILRRVLARIYVAVAETSYQMLEILSFSDRERASRPSTEISVLTFMVKKVQWCFPECLFLENRKVNLRLSVVREFRALYFARKPVVVLQNVGFFLRIWSVQL